MVRFFQAKKPPISITSIVRLAATELPAKAANKRSPPDLPIGVFESLVWVSLIGQFTRYHSYTHTHVRGRNNAHHDALAVVERIDEYAVGGTTPDTR